MRGNVHPTQYPICVSGQQSMIKERAEQAQSDSSEEYPPQICGSGDPNVMSLGSLSL